MIDTVTKAQRMLGLTYQRHPNRRVIMVAMQSREVSVPYSIRKRLGPNFKPLSPVCRMTLKEINSFIKQKIAGKEPSLSGRRSPTIQKIEKVYRVTQDPTMMLKLVNG